MKFQQKQIIQKSIINQAGQERLNLNDLSIGRDGAQLLSQLIPQYHTNIIHLDIKGNRIDSDGFQMICMSLMHCPGLVSIEAQWNLIGSSGSGIQALLHLVRNLRFLQTIDLKNNHLTHQHSQLIAQIIKTNNRSLKILDLRWNQIGEIGAQIIYPSLALNNNLKYIGLEDNRISSNSLAQINDIIKNKPKGPLNPSVSNKNLISHQNTQQPIFPISDNQYPSMDVQMRTGQLRNKIQTQQQQAGLHQEKLQTQIHKVIQKLRIKGSQFHQTQLKYDSLWAQQTNLQNQLRQAQRLVMIQKQRFLGLDKTFLSQKGSLKNEKHQINEDIQIMMQKNLQRQQREVQDLNQAMLQKYDRLQAYLKQIINDKRIARQKLAQIKQDTLNFKLNKEGMWDQITSIAVNKHKNSWQQQINAFQQLIAKAQASVKSQKKKGQYLSQQLSNFVMKGLKKQQKLQKQIFDLQNKIKDLHRDMALSNVQIQQNNYKVILNEASIIQKQANVDLSRRYIKFIQSQTTVNLDIQRLKNDQDAKALRHADEVLQIRLVDLQKALRQQQAQNKLIQNHYSKLLAQLQILTKNTIKSTIFQEGLTTKI